MMMVIYASVGRYVILYLTAHALITESLTVVRAHGNPRVGRRDDLEHILGGRDGNRAEGCRKGGVSLL